MKLYFAFELDGQKIANEIIQHFAIPIKRGDLSIWHRAMVFAGGNAKEAIDKNLEDSNVVVFFLSSDLLASDYFYEIEKKVIPNVIAKKQTLIPILASPCLWEMATFNAELSPQILPRDKKSISIHPQKDQAIFEVVQEIFAATKKTDNNETSSQPSNDNSNQMSDADLLNFKNSLKLKVGENEHEQVFSSIKSHLEEYSYNTLTNTIILLEARFNKLQSDISLGTISNDNKNLEMNQVTNSLLNLIDNLK